MTYPQIQLVDAATAAATVLFDFNDITATPAREVLADDVSFGVPQLEGDPDAVDPLYGPRTVSFTCQMTGTKPQVAAAQSTLARRILASGQGWLRVRMTETSTILFFRTYRGEPGDLSFDLIQTTSATKVERWQLEVSLPCEPLLYGERVTQPTQTLTNDPSAANAMRLVLPVITGDARTPLDIILTQSSFPGVRNAITVMSHSSFSVIQPGHLPIGTGDGATGVGPDTSAPISDAAYAGGSYREVSFATNANMATRLLLPNVAAARGRYRAVLRVSSTVAGTAYRLTLGGASINTTPTVAIQPNGTAPTWVDLGAINPPKNAATSPNGPAQSASQNVGTISAARVSGSGSLRLDHLMLIPVGSTRTTDARSIRATTQDLMSSGSLYLDGTYGEATSDAPAWGGIGLDGVFPCATPGGQNVLTFLLSTSPFATDSLTRTAQVSVSYYPRFLYLGDS